MSTAIMHFGPEWMRTKNQPLSRSQQQPSPPPANGLPQAPSSLATYSALVSVTSVVSEKLDESQPFRYSKEELLTIYQEGGGKGGLGLEVDRWEGVVREVAVEPVSLREMVDGEKKLFAGSLNSEIRRRPSQSTDHFSPNASGMDRARIPGGSVTGSRDRFGAMKRKDSAGGTADSSLTSMPRKPSLSALQMPGLLSPTSPRTRTGYTSNFDGVLNNGESWMARRRFTETSLKSSNSSNTEIQAEDAASKPEGITEAKEEDSASAVHVYKGDCKFLSPASAGIDSAVSTSHSEICVTNNTGSLPTYHDYQDVGQSPAILDLAAVEWSYKDPTGQVQGPFRADLMQKWYEEGYFTPDLPMKRTHLDSQWYTVEALVSQATGASVFLTPPLPAGPAGPTQQPCLRTPEYSHNEPFQPAPIRSLRTSTLESSLTGASLTSDSTSSSLGASQMGNSSPEPSAFLGRDKRPYGTTEADGRIPAFGLQDLSTPSFIGTHLNSDGFVHDSTTTFEAGTVVPDLDVGLSRHVFHNHPPMIQDSWTGFPNSSFGIQNANLTTSRGVPPTNFFNDSVARGYGFDTNHLVNFSGPQSGNIVSNYAPSHELGGVIPFTGLANQQPFVSQIPDFIHTQQPGQSSGLRIQESTTYVPAIHNGLPLEHSPWSAVPDPRNHVSVAVAEHLDSTTASGGLNGVAVRGTLSGEASANGLNVGHNAPQELSQLSDEKLLVFEQDCRTASVSITTFETSSASETGKSSIKPKPPLDQVPLSDNSVAQAPVKSAWTKDDDGTGKGTTTTSISLRAIQDAEARRQQSFKATEREKEKTRATITSEAKDDLQSFTTSWGLPTSQAGARSNMYLPIKDVPASSVVTNQTPVSPVWTATVKTPVVKKSMKEIQEEEERRKMQVTRDTSVTASSKKTTPSPILAASVNTNPWTTVRSNGKATQPSRAPHTSFSLAVSGPPAVRSTAPLNQRVATTSSTKMRPVIPNPGEVPDAPSHEFLKWLGESLKGLNASANVEEIMSMLFSFPLDPDSSTLEIISDTIYANSTTLDGRRFAADFIAKRKGDVAARSKGLADSGKTPANKPVSIADVVKAVPKSSQPEWGFKVVNKKKKGGRS